MQGWAYLDTYLYLHGNEQLKIENCRKILEYHDVLVRLQTFDYNDSSMMVTGKISSLHLTEKS